VVVRIRGRAMRERESGKQHQEQHERPGRRLPARVASQRRDGASGSPR
jgi:hypothetical protein